MGALRFRSKGSAGGHNGMKSIIHACLSDEVHRWRVGIKGNGEYHDLADYVLGKFTSDENE